MQSELLIVPVFFVSFFGMIFGIAYMRNKENMALIEKGFNPRENKFPPTTRAMWTLRYGLLLCGVGAGLLFAFLIDELALNHKGVLPGGGVYTKDFPQIYFALIGMFGGLGLMISHLIEKKDGQNRKNNE
jgi:hypothetical protein